MTRTPRLAIDLDGVLTEHPAPLARAANAKFGLTLPDSAFVDSAGHAVSEDVRAWVYSEEGPAAQLVVSPLALEFLQRAVEIFGAGNVFIITARPESAAGMTSAWLENHGLQLCEVTYADDKVSVARRLGVTHAVEDSFRHARAYQDAGINVHLLLNPGVSLPRDIMAQVAGDLATIADQLDRSISLAISRNGARPKIVVSDVIDPGAYAMLATEGEIIDVDGTNVPALHQAVRDADALVVRSESNVDGALLSHAPRLRVVARAGVGVDNIDVEAATRAGVLVLNAPGANSISAAEHTIATLLAIARQLPQANASMHQGRWERKRFRLFDLRGKTIGIVGLGRVGSAVAKRLHAFETRLIGHDPYVHDERFEQLDVERVSYEDLLAQSDVVTFHCPLTPETYHYLSRETMALLKPGVIVINCARGEVVDHEALAEALDTGVVAAAGVDVFPKEPVTESPLWGRPNVILTPHLGGSSVEAQAAVGEIIGVTTLAALRGESVPNAVNLPATTVEASVLKRLTNVSGAAGLLLSVLEPESPRSFELAVGGCVSPEVADLVLNAALSEALHRWLGTRVTPVNARLVAQEQEISVRLGFLDESECDIRGVVEFSFETRGETPHRVTVRWAGEEVGIYEVDRFSLGLPLAGDMLITHHQDKPGVIGAVGTILGEYRVNIAGMQVGRHHQGGEAIMVLNVDNVIPEAARERILEIDGISTAYVVSLPATSNDRERGSS
jgi:D-3-phosphoglycerate dehydrogenase